MTNEVTTPRISLIVPVWPPSLKSALLSASLQRAGNHFGESLEVIGILNGGGADEWARIAPTGTACRFALLSENAGVPRAWNIGASLATGRTLIFTNQDVEIDVADLEAIERELDDEFVALAGVRGAFWSLDDKDVLRHVAYYDGEEPGDVDLVSGFLFGARRARWAAIGGADDSLSPLGAEEVDLGLAARDRRWRVRALGRFGSRHRFGISAAPGHWAIFWLGRFSELRSVSARNLAYLKEKYSPGEGGGGFLGANTVTAEVFRTFLPSSWLTKVENGVVRICSPEGAGESWSVDSIRITGSGGRGRLGCCVRAPSSGGARWWRVLVVAAIEGAAYRRYGPGLEFETSFPEGVPKGLPLRLGFVARGLLVRLRHRVLSSRRT